MEQDFLIEDVKKAEAYRQADKVRRRRERKPLWREYLETSIIALLAAIMLRLFVVSAYRVSSASMEDTLFEGDYIFVNKLAYDYGSGPRQGDIVVFKYPNNPNKDFIKRIVALPGQTVEIADKVVYVDGQVAAIPENSKNVDQKIIPADLSFRDNFGPYVVPPTNTSSWATTAMTPATRASGVASPRKTSRARRSSCTGHGNRIPMPPAGGFHTSTTSSSGSATLCGTSRPISAGVVWAIRSDHAFRHLPALPLLPQPLPLL